MRRLLEGFHHRPGFHCGSTALADALNYHGAGLSEAMCFGLGEGAAFIYVVAPGASPARALFTRGPTLEESLFRNLGLPFRWSTTEDPAEGWRTAKAGVDAGLPVLMRCDLRYLDYYNSRTHFSGHVVALAGYDEEAGVAYLADTQFAGLQEEPLGNLAKARSSRAYPFPVHHDCYPVPRPGALAPFEKAIPRALASNARWMIESEHPCGLVALEAAARDVPNWAKDLEEDAWRWAARFTYQVIERRGTGGAAFRRLYYDFLVEGGEHVPALKADRFLHPLDEARNAWHQAAEAFRRASETDEAAYLEEAARRLLRVHARETVFWRTVAKEFS